MGAASTQASEQLEKTCNRLFEDATKRQQKK
jgi:hypothetical protein